jgi:hypothetical protein
MPTMTIAPGPINEPPTWPTMTMTMTSKNDIPSMSTLPQRRHPPT